MEERVRKNVGVGGVERLYDSKKSSAIDRQAWRENA